MKLSLDYSSVKAPSILMTLGSRCFQVGAWCILWVLSAWQVSSLRSFGRLLKTSTLLFRTICLRFLIYCPALFSPGILSMFWDEDQLCAWTPHLHQCLSKALLPSLFPSKSSWSALTLSAQNWEKPPAAGELTTLRFILPWGLGLFSSFRL